MVMVPNPDYHRAGDFALVDGRLSLAARPQLTFGNIALYRSALFEALPRGEKIRMLPLYRDWIARGWVGGERYDGVWANVGTPDELRESMVNWRHRQTRKSCDEYRCTDHRDQSLLDFSGLPRFADIRPEHVAPAPRCVAWRGAHHDRGVATAPGRRPGIPLCNRCPMLDCLDRAWTQVGHLNAVVNTPGCARHTTKTCRR